MVPEIYTTDGSLDPPCGHELERPEHNSDIATNAMASETTETQKESRTGSHEAGRPERTQMHLETQHRYTVTREVGTRATKGNCRKSDEARNREQAL